MTSQGQKLLGLAGSNLKQISSGSPKTPLRNITHAIPPTPKSSTYGSGTINSVVTKLHEMERGNPRVCCSPGLVGGRYSVLIASTRSSPKARGYGM